MTAVFEILLFTAVIGCVILILIDAFDDTKWL